MNVNISNKEYERYADKTAKKSPLFKDCVKAFFTGGIICSIGQALFFLFDFLGIDAETGKISVSVTLIFITAVLTGIGIFDKIAKHAGAGTLVPITGFANAVVSPALDTKSEGMVLGLGVKIFIIAGPVILYGTVASVIYGVIYYFFGR